MAERICLLAIPVLILLLTVKVWRADFLPLVRIATAVTVGALLITAAQPLVAYLQELTRGSAASEYAESLFKALGVAILTQCCSEISKECGENGLATGVELVGKLEILLLSLPLIREILSLAKELMEIGA